MGKKKKKGGKKKRKGKKKKGKAEKAPAEFTIPVYKTPAEAAPKI